jgi:hypothetical protein
MTSTSAWGIPKPLAICSRWVWTVLEKLTPAVVSSTSSHWSVEMRLKLRKIVLASQYAYLPVFRRFLFHTADSLVIYAYPRTVKLLTTNQ